MSGSVFVPTELPLMQNGSVEESAIEEGSPCRKQQILIHSASKAGMKGHKTDPNMSVSGK